MRIGNLVFACSAFLCALPLCGGQSADAQASLPLSLKQAAALALTPEGSARVQLAREMVMQAQSQSAQARAALLPNLEASVAQQSQTRNLEAFGIGTSMPPNPYFSFPTFVGPFTTFDARVTARQSVFDLSSIRRFQASRAGISLAEAERASAEDQVIGEVARTYLAGLRADAAVRTAEANVGLAQALLSLAESQKQAGAGTGIEITRAGVQLAGEKQRLLVARNERTRTHLQLLRAVGLDMEKDLSLTDSLAFAPATPLTVRQALALALESRADWLAEKKRLQSLELNYSATRAERLPSLSVFGDYGAIGLGINDSLPTRTFGFMVRVPVYDGGGRDARRAQGASQLRLEQIRADDLRVQIELEVRLALDNLSSAAEQVKTAEEGLALAESELQQARRRYEAGVSFSLEVTDAQTRLARARDSLVLALYAYNVAVVQRAASMGTIRQMIQ